MDVQTSNPEQHGEGFFLFFLNIQSLQILTPVYPIFWSLGANLVVQFALFALFNCTLYNIWRHLYHLQIHPSDFWSVCIYFSFLLFVYVDLVVKSWVRRKEKCGRKAGDNISNVFNQRTWDQCPFDGGFVNHDDDDDDWWKFGGKP